MFIGRKSNLGRQINYQGRYLYEVGKQKLSLEIYGQHYLHIYCIYYVVHGSFISCRLQVYVSSNGIYSDIKPHNWAQAVESLDLNYDFMHTIGNLTYF